MLIIKTLHASNCVYVFEKGALSSTNIHSISFPYVSITEVHRGIQVYWIFCIAVLNLAPQVLQPDQPFLVKFNVCWRKDTLFFRYIK